ncbi:hypothetical protein [Rhizobium sp. 21-4511-3d]
MQASIVERFPEPSAPATSMICPCCLQFVEGVTVLADPTTCRITVGTKTALMKRKQFVFAKYLLDAYPLMAANENIMRDVFPDRNGRKLKKNIIAVNASQIRPIMDDLGFSIETIRGTGYRLVRHQEAGGRA